MLRSGGEFDSPTRPALAPIVTITDLMSWKILFHQPAMAMAMAMAIFSLVDGRMHLVHVIVVP